MSRRLAKIAIAVVTLTALASFFICMIWYVSGRSDGTASLTNGDEMKLFVVRSPNHLAINAIAISPQHIAMSSGSNVEVWTLSGEKIATIPTNAFFVYSLAFSPDASRLAIGAYNDAVYVVDTMSWQTQSYTAMPPNACVTSLVFSSDGASIYFGTGIHDNRIWKQGILDSKRTEIYCGNPDQGVKAIALLASLHCLVVMTSEGELNTIGTNTIDGKYPVRQIVPDMIGGMANCYGVDNSNGLIAIGKDDGAIALLSGPSLDGVGFLPDRHKFLRRLASSPDGKWLISVSGEDAPGAAKITIWNMTEMTSVIGIASDFGISALAFSPDSHRFATGNFAGEFTLWDIAKLPSKKGENGRSP